MSKTTFREVANGKGWLTDAMMDPKAALEEFEEIAPSGFENLPTVSIQPQTFIAVKFLEEPVQRGQDKFKRDMWWVNVEILMETNQGYDRESKKKVKLAIGDKASMNMNRHAGLLAGAKAQAPLKGKSFGIANLGKVPTAKGNTAMDYRWKGL